MDRESLGFGQEFGSGVFIGTMKTDSIEIQNGGLDDLKIETATYSVERDPDGGIGEDAFTIEGPPKTTLKGKERTFIRIVFTPKGEKIYRGSVLIVSNAEDNPATKSAAMKKIVISGRGFKQGDAGP